MSDSPSFFKGCRSVALLRPLLRGAVKAACGCDRGVFSSVVRPPMSLPLPFFRHDLLDPARVATTLEIGLKERFKDRRYILQRCVFGGHREDVCVVV